MSENKTAISYPITNGNNSNNDLFKSTTSCELKPIPWNELLKLMEEQGLLPNSNTNTKDENDVLNTTMIEVDDDEHSRKDKSKSVTLANKITPAVTQSNEKKNCSNKEQNNVKNNSNSSSGIVITAKKPPQKNGNNFNIPTIKVTRENENVMKPPLNQLRTGTNITEREKKYYTPRKFVNTPLKQNGIHNSIINTPSQNALNNRVRNQQFNSTTKRQHETVLREKNVNITPVPIARQVKKENGDSNENLSKPMKQLFASYKTVVIAKREYIVLEKLGKGGSGQVYKCLDRELMLDRAMKVVDLNVEPITANGYVNEAKLLKELQGSDHVIKMFDFEVIQKKLYVVLEKGEIDFSTLLRRVINDTEVQKYTIIFYWLEMLKCVRVIHKKGIIHSDLKPSNFLMVEGRLKLIDFGIASRISPEMTSVFKEVLEGTFSYMSPEAIIDCRDSSQSPSNGKPRIKISYKSDVWSLGCILYQMIYKRPPFYKYTNPLAKISAIADEKHRIEYPPLENIPKQLIEVIKQCLIYNMRSRPSVDELLVMFQTDRCY